MFGFEPVLLLSGGGILIFLIVLASVIPGLWQKCGPNQAMIISGLRHGNRRYRPSPFEAR